MSRATAILGVSTAAATIVLTIGLAELTVRQIDGLPLLVWRLPPAAVKASPSNPRDRADERYLSTIPLAMGVDPGWYRHNPPPRPDIPMSPAIAQRYERYKNVDVYGAFFAWNRAYLSRQVCAHSTLGALGLLDDFYVFDAPGTEFPIFRHLSNVRPPQWFPTNRFGWRGPDLALNKPSQTIRIAFVGSSTTIDPYGVPFSHIEYLGEWLKEWAAARRLPYRFEVINAARTGIDTMSVAAIVEQEVVPLEPDLVIYDGSNDFGPRAQLAVAAQGLTAPRRTSTTPSELDSYSALARRIHVFANRVGSGNGSEPRKPAYPLLWPSDVDELHPEVTHTPLPMNLHTIVGLFEAMRTATESVGGQFAVASPVRMVRDGLTLRLPDDQGLYDFLNSYYPMTYAQVQRLSDFHRRVFRAYAERHGLLYLDSASLIPLDPVLFGDAVHMTAAGLRLKAWTDLQFVIPWVEGEIESGRLPRAMQHPRSSHPAFPAADYPMVSKAEILANCR